MLWVEAICLAQQFHSKNIIIKTFPNVNIEKQHEMDDKKFFVAGNPRLTRGKLSIIISGR